MTIFKMRKITGLSQTKFAEYLNIPVYNIQHWEQGVRQPPEYVIKLIERILRLEGLI